MYDQSLLSLERFRTYHTQLFINRDPHFYLAFQIEALFIRFLQNIEADRLSICDQSIYSILAYSRVLSERGLLSNPYYQTFYAAFLTLRAYASWPALVIQFTCDPAVAHSRLVERARPHEVTAYTQQFLSELKESYAAVIRDIPAEVPTVTIDTSAMTRQQAVEEIETILNAHQSRHTEPRNDSVSHGS